MSIIFIIFLLLILILFIVILKSAECKKETKDDTCWELFCFLVPQSWVSLCGVSNETSCLLKERREWEPYAVSGFKLKTLTIWNGIRIVLRNRTIWYLLQGFDNMYSVLLKTLSGSPLLLFSWCLMLENRGRESIRFYSVCSVPQYFTVICTLNFTFHPSKI